MKSLIWLAILAAPLATANSTAETSPSPALDTTPVLAAVATVHPDSPAIDRLADPLRLVAKELERTLEKQLALPPAVMPEELAELSLAAR